VVGTVMLKHLPGLEDQLTDGVEVSWHLGSDSWGQGYATEMAAAVMEHGFQTQGLERIYAVAHLENEASFAVMRRLGMKHLGPNQVYYDGAKADVFAIDAPDWISPES
jgi:RimJ/RimL family protein N-acetyltransferase